ncbi:hypothetical protein MKW98_027507 [Papaver atlanticum]|uniref:Uncharacterized protein n=1 Tax=Papaver atlanticum TaxID=357466 RepID=A0AAD4RW04_9MAGN|nr:hypothetical protein MKW98_027507 [Papaver atlanticum]
MGQPPLRYKIYLQCAAWKIHKRIYGSWRTEVLVNLAGCGMKFPAPWFLQTLYQITNLYFIKTMVFSICTSSNSQLR